ncbi:TPA: hypothetical protein ACGO2M_001282 [Streptococcus suis]
MVTLEVAATFSLLGVFVGMLTHQLPLNLFFLATMGIGFGASGPKFNAKFVNSMPEEQLGTIGGGVSTYFMSGQALLRLVVSGLVLLLSVDQISWIFLSASGFLALYCYLLAYQEIKKHLKISLYRLIFLFSYSYLCYNVLDCYSAKIKFRHS